MIVDRNDCNSKLSMIDKANYLCIDLEFEFSNAAASRSLLNICFILVINSDCRHRRANQFTKIAAVIYSFHNQKYFCEFCYSVGILCSC